MKAYLTIAHGDTTLGTLRLNLRPDIVPRTVENFVHFLTNTKEKNSASSSAVGGTTVDGEAGYRNSTFHRIIPKFMAQAGDFINHDGTGSTSIYGPSFADENFLLSHSQRGTLSMANSGANTNGCQFFISFKATAHLDGRHVVFGDVDWREDDESAAVLEKLERVKTDRRSDRPLEQVKIVDCGVIEERKSARGAGKVSEGGGSKLVGEAKKNKLLQAYGDVTPAADEDEIDLDEEDDDMDDRKNEKRDNASSSKVAGDANDEDADEIDIEGDNDEPAADDSELATSATGKLSKKAALQKRLAALRTKINQSRTLNRREVHAEATRMGTDEASMQERKRQNKQDRNAKQKEYDTYVVGKLCNVGEGAAESKAEQKKLASLSQPASDSIRQMNARADKKEKSQYGPDDYYNPEGQYSNYERNLNSVHHVASRRGDTDASATLDSYDPTVKNFSNNNASKQSSISEKEGAKRLATEMKRRTEKRANQKRKLEFDAEDVTSINDRNKRFNQKIGRNFDKHTAEIRQNLERGTAL
mmetsp:Transcript_8904/g.20001  ORF Transcript_8904/g.20001 Transcript_8904/m.20001 type:complete len:531 (-) Transcript_8904:220-1812(-)